MPWGFFSCCQPWSEYFFRRCLPWGVNFFLSNTFHLHRPPINFAWSLISEEILGFSMLYWCLHYPYSLQQHMTFSDLQPKLK